MIINPSSGGGKYISNPNLLDNWYFGNPVDQRGGYVTRPLGTYNSTPENGTELGNLPANGYYKATYYNQWWYSFVMDGVTYYQTAAQVLRGYTGAGYTIDRWTKIAGLPSVSIGENGIIMDNSSSTADNWLLQKLGTDIDYVNKEVTLTVLLSTGELYTTTKMFTSNNAVYLDQTFDLARLRWQTLDNGIKQFVIYANKEKKIEIVAAKLELGSQQTLAHLENGEWVLNEIPNKAEEEFKCIHSTADSSDTYANKPVNSYTYGTEDLEAGVSPLATGKLYFVYE